MNLYNDYIEKARDLANSVYDQSVKALSKTETERRLAEALSHANWGASSTLMWELAQSTNDLQEFQVIMREVWAACASTGRNWRVAYKGLALLEFLLKNGHKRCIEEARENRSKIRKLETFSYVNNDVEKGNGVREKAKAVTELLDDESLLKRERTEAAKLRAKFTGVGRDGQHGGSFTTGAGYDDDGDDKEKIDDSDEEDKKRKSKKKSSKKKGSDDEVEEDEEDERPSKSKSKKKPTINDEEDFDADFGSSKTSKQKASKKKAEEDDTDFGFSDDDSSKKESKAPIVPPRVGPIKSISVSIPGTKTASSTNTVNIAIKKASSAGEEVDLLGGFDPFGSAPANTSTVPKTAQSSQPQQTTAASIMDLFGAPAAPIPTQVTNNGFGGFSSMAPQTSFPSAGGIPIGMSGGFQPQGMMMPQMGQQMMGGSAQPQMMMGQPQQMMMPQMNQPQQMMMPQMNQPQQMMMSQMGQPQNLIMPQMGQAQQMMMPQMSQQQPMMMSQSNPNNFGFPPMGPPMGMTGAAPRSIQGGAPAVAQKKDAFSGLMDFGLSSAPPASAPKPPSQSLI